MKAILRFAAAVIFAGLSFVPQAYAQSLPATAKVVATCGTQTYVVSSSQAITQDTTGKSCDTGGGGTVAPTGGTSTDISGTVISGGSYQTVAAASGTRKNCTIQNPVSATEPLNVKFGTMAQPYSLNAGQAISALNGVVVAQDAITLTATTNGHAYAGTCQ